MQPTSDAQLLRDYAERGAESAFAAIVHRYTNLVYSCVVRQVGSPEVAAEITQNVFVGLARGARALSPKLAENASLAGWLCRSARNLSLNFRRDEFRRHSRERQAMQTFNPASETGLDWERLRPVLDEAMSELNESDHDALVLRFFQNHDLRAVGVALGVTDDAAQKRVTRALDKLRDLLSRRGVTGSAVGLSVILAGNAVQAAPAGLAAAISSAVSLVGTTAAITATAATATFVKAVTMTTVQKTLIAATVAALAAAGLYEARQIAQLRDQNQELANQRDQLIAERDHNAAAARPAAGASPQPDMNELLRLRGEVAMLRTQTNELARLQREANRRAQSPTSAPGPVGEYVPREQYSFAGFAEPESTVKTMIWGSSQGDVKTVLASLSPRERADAEQRWSTMPESEVSARILSDNDNKMFGYRITQMVPLAEDEMVVTIYQEGRNKEKKMRLVKIGNEWKYDGPPAH